MIAIAIATGQNSAGLDPAASAFIQATGITGELQKAAINNLVLNLKKYNLWSKMKAVYPFVTDNRNLLSYTTTFINPNYQTDSTATFTLNNTTAPDGTNTGVRFTAVGSNNSYFYSANTIGGNNFGAGNKAFSIYVKAGTFSGSASIAITSDGSSSTSVIALTNNWQRITVTRNVIVAGNNSQYFIDMNSTTMTSGQYFYIWAPQFENGTTATDYQPIATTQQAFIASQFKYNLVNPVDSDAAFRLVFNGGWTHSSNGATPNGVNAYADTKLNENTIMTLNSTHLSYYSRTNIIGLYCDIGTSYSNQSNIYSNYLGSFYPRIQAVNSGIAISYNTAAFFLANRVNSTQVQGWRNSVKNTLSSTAINKENLNYYLGAGNGLSFAVDYSVRQCAFSTIGDGLSDTEAANLYTRVQAFQTALSRQV
jgi:hypothetical protein